MVRFGARSFLRWLPQVCFAALLLSACDGAIEVPTNEPDENPLPVQPDAPSPEGAPGTPTPEGPSPEAPGPESPEPGEPGTPAPEGTPEPDAPPQTCSVWQDCGIGDDNTNGYECEGGTCTCDPDVVYAGNCQNLGGQWDAASCACLFDAIDIGGTCSVWQDCPPGFDSTQSGFDCVNNTCTCDPNGTYSTNCQSQGGYWVPQECFCVFSDSPPPQTTPDPDGFASDEPPVCWWHHEQPPCDPDRYVDTSHYEERCFYNADDVWTCEQVWVQEGHYEPGACPPPIWDLRCIY